MVMKKNLIISWISFPPPPSPISYQWRMKNIHQEEREALLHDIEVYCKYIHSSEKKKTHSLQVKGLYHRAGTDHLKRLKIKNQLRKWLKRTIVTAEGGSPFWGVREHARQEKF